MFRLSWYSKLATARLRRAIRSSRSLTPRQRDWIVDDAFALAVQAEWATEVSSSDYAGAVQQMVGKVLVLAPDATQGLATAVRRHAGQLNTLRVLQTDSAADPYLPVRDVNDVNAKIADFAKALTWTAGRRSSEQRISGGAITVDLPPGAAV